MEKGFNSDVNFQGYQFHVQTEDWGYKNPYLVSTVFQNGAVRRSIKTHYSEVLPRGLESPTQSVRLAMRLQHDKVIDLLTAGRLF